MKDFLSPHQLDTIVKIKPGCIVHGGVGVGKSRTALAYYYQWCGGNLKVLCERKNMTKPDEFFACHLYIITTARKRDLLDWYEELAPFYINPDGVTIDSWNNIKKYTDVENAFFIFDEQRLTGNGVWVKSFLKIAKVNAWIMLSATPGDKWEDYIPVFIANGFYRNRTEFMDRHVLQTWRHNYPQTLGYTDVRRLVRLRDQILVEMPMERHTVRHHDWITCDYKRVAYDIVTKRRWNPWDEKPIETASELCLAQRHITNSDESRQMALLEIMEDHPAVIVFYSFDYELEILRSLSYPEGTIIAEWNGHLHQPVPDGDKWIYLVQYTAGCEGWNCIKTDTIIFYSQQYSYKTQEQAEGRIDRMNTAYRDLYYYHLTSTASIDKNITAALKNKQDFNEGRYFNRLPYWERRENAI